MRFMAIAFVTLLMVSAEPPAGELEGGWTLVRVEQGGRVIPPAEFFWTDIFFAKSEFEYSAPRVSNRGPFSLGTYEARPDRLPKELDFIAKNPSRGEKVRKGIYEINGDILRFSMSPPGQDRPTKFTPELQVEVWERGRRKPQGQQE